ncbi:MAG TPA: Gfo/Idh/MocA family oxidoreductase [Thermomicrobiales bacterium]|jgi:predicted dehydrogenase
MTERLRAGVVGCGGVAQMMQLPYLRELRDRYEMAALCDLDGATLDKVADDYGVRARHQDVAGLLAEPLDVVLVLTSGNHTEAVLAALESGRHVFSEKPLTYTLAETDQIIAAEQRAGKTVMVGMMKQYDPGYRRGVRALSELRDLRYVDARVMHPDDRLYRMHHPIVKGGQVVEGETADTNPVYGRAMFERVQTAILGSESTDLLKEATGTDRPEVLTAYALLIGSSIHDATVLRGALGPASNVVTAHVWAAGTSFTATIAYPNDVRATYTWSLLPYLKHYVQDYSFYASDGRVHIRFPSPYLQNAPTIVDVESMDGTELHETRITTSYQEAFKFELIHFHDCVTTGRRPLTDAAGFRTDLELLTAIARAM